VDARTHSRYVWNLALNRSISAYAKDAKYDKLLIPSQAWSKCVDSERNADNDYTETCRETVRFVILKYRWFLLWIPEGRSNIFLYSYKDWMSSLLLLFADTKAKGVYA